MSLRDWLATATPATTATPRPQTGLTVASVATVAGGSESGDGYRIDYTGADLTEFDALIDRYCALIQRPDKRTSMLAARKRMRPATIAAEIAEFRTFVAALKPLRDAHAPLECVDV
jgi:hypothetical protein